jgi:hypothetical protein
MHAWGLISPLSRFCFLTKKEFSPQHHAIAPTGTGWEQKRVVLVALLAQVVLEALGSG